MILESMTATFGKLEGQTLTFHPGLNVIPAPNEWGKSTWCAFLLAMLYGIDTKSRSTQNALSDKEHYAPWSGSPMSGKIELIWNDRRITIERTSRGRIPLGEFRAYETESGLSVPELTASNCGQQLLGVERSVFRRAGFIRLSDLPVTADEDLRRRLNALVTTGDESGEAVKLQKSLKELKNRICRKPGGQLPQLMEQQARLEEALEDIQEKQRAHENLQHQLRENAAEQALLRTHWAALEYQDVQRDWSRVQNAEAAAKAAQQEASRQEAACSALPTRQEAQAKQASLEQLRKELYDFQQWQQSQPIPPVQPERRACFEGLSAEETRRMVEADTALLQAKSHGLIPLCIMALAAAVCGVLLFLGQRLPAILSGAVFGISAVCTLVLFGLQGRKKRTLLGKYGTLQPTQWQEWAEDDIAAMIDYRVQNNACREAAEQQKRRRQEMKQLVTQVCGDENPEQCRAHWASILDSWQSLDDARERAKQTREQYEALKAMARPLPKKPENDPCTETEAETEAQLNRLQEQEKKLQEADNKLLGLLESMGDEGHLRRKQMQQKAQTKELYRYVEAIDLAQKTLEEASSQLQRRFAPRISQLGQQYLRRLTLGRYDRLMLNDNLTLRCGSTDELTLRDPLWRSEGTTDQLYLALRLAVAQELTPDAPLILDDAFVRFDNPRLQAALELLQEIAKEKQVILFTCQSREQEMLG